MPALVVFKFNNFRRHWRNMTTSWQMKWLHQAWGFFVMLGEAAALDVLCHVCLRGRNTMEIWQGSLKMLGLDM